MAESRVVPSASVDASGGLTNTVTANAPAPATAATTTAGAREIQTLRKRLEEIEARKTKIAADVAKRQAADPSNVALGITSAEQTAINEAEKERGEVIQKIAAAEAKEDTATKPTVVSPSNKDPYIIQIDPKTNAVIKDPETGKPPRNPNWDGTTDNKPQHAMVGNNLILIDDEGNITVPYTDKDAAALDARQTAVSEANQRTAAAAQKATQLAEEARIRIEEAKAKGEHAETIQNQLVIDLRKAHDEWTRADGDKQTAQAQLRDYNTNRHAIALETISREELEQKRITEANLNKRELRSQDLTKAAADATVKASLANQRLSSGQAYMGNVLSTMSELNKTVQPGSDAVAQMLPGLLNLGEAFFSKLGGLPGDVTSNPAAKEDAAAKADATTKLDTTAADNIRKLTTGDTRTNPEFYNDETAHRQLGITPPTESQTKDFEAQVARQRAQLLADQSGVDLADLLGASASTGMTPYDYLQMTGEYRPMSGAFAATPKLSFQTGGVVPGLPGQPVPIMAHAGETVLPTGQPGMPPPPIPPGPLPPALQSAGPPVPAAPPPPPPAPVGPPPMGPESVIAQFLAVMTQLLGDAGGMSDLAASAAAGTGNPPPAAANPTLPGSAVPGIPPAAAAAQARMQPIAPDGSPFAKPDDVARIFGRQPAAPQGPQLASAPNGMPQQQMPMPAGAMR